jgi:TolB-like protein/DNA-binding winged helix-turn-helix (wHTH) protein/tetratricopeptide (TPR) repeat protein
LREIPGVEDTGRTARVLHFGPFTADLEARSLYKQGRRIKLQDQPFQVLAVLLEHPGELITREELRQKLWASNTFVDFDHGLNIAINKLREALGDSADEPQFIQTVPRRGYRFLAALQPDKASTEASSGEATATAKPRTPRRSIYAVGAGALVLAAALALVLTEYRSSTPARLEPRRIESLAVLPLRNLSGDSEQEYFADGMTELLITNLAQISALRVISRTSIMRYKDLSKPLPQIGQELHVDAVVEGSVLRAGGRVRISAQLLDTASDKHLWAQSYERELRDVLLLQSEIARTIADEIRAKITPEERARLATTPVVDPAAQEDYIKGRFYWNRRSEEGLQTGIRYFQQAIDLQPNYAEAYDGLADCWIGLAWYGYAPSKDALLRAKAAATKALELNGSMAQAQTSLAFVNASYDFDWQAAEHGYQRAIALNPNYANAHHWYADLLSAMGRHQQAILESERARELDPLSPIINAWLGWRYYFARRYDQAIAQYRKALDLDPNFPPAHLVLGQAYEQKKLLKEATTELEQAVNLSGSGAIYLASLAHAYGVAGRRGDALKLIRKLERLAAGQHVSSYDMALAFVGVGEKDQAFSWLEKAASDHAARLIFLNVEPRFDSLRSDPRYAELMRRLGFAA